MLEQTIFLTVSFFAGILASLAGFGSSMVLLPVALLFFDAKSALFLVACFHLFGNLFKVRLFLRSIDKRVAFYFGLPSVIFAFVGAMLVSRVPVDSLRTWVAIFIIVFALYSFIKPYFRLPETNLTAIIGGSLSGFMAGLIGLGGAIRSTFLIAFELPKEAYVGTAALIALVIDLTRVPTYWLTNVVPPGNYYQLLLLLIITAFVGTRIGKVLLVKLDQSTFRKIVLVMLLVVGIKLLF